MDQNFTFLSGLSSKRAKSEAKILSKKNNSSLVHELNSLALNECGMTWAVASKTFGNIPAPLINKRDVEEILSKHNTFTLNGELRPSDQNIDEAEVAIWKNHLLTLNLLCTYFNSAKFNKNEISQPANITPLIFAKYFSDFHNSILPAYKLSQLPEYKNLLKSKEFIFEFESKHKFDLFGLVILASIHMGYQYQYVLNPNINVGFFKINIGWEDLDTFSFDEYDDSIKIQKLKSAESSFNEIDNLFKHTGIKNLYYPNSIEDFKKYIDAKLNSEIFAKVTPKGLGVQIYGTESQLRGMYEALHLVLDPNYDEDECESNEVMFLFELCYDIRKAFQGNRDELKIKINNKPVYGVNVLLPTLVTQMHCLYKFLCNIHLNADLKNHVQMLIDAVLDAICQRSPESYQGVVDWMVKTPMLCDQFDFELLSIACNDHLTRSKGIQSRLKNLPFILTELIKNDGSKLSFARKIGQAQKSLNEYFEEHNKW